MEVGTIVRQVKGRPESIGRTGTVKAVLGSLAGDTLVEVEESDGTIWQAYTRQLRIDPEEEVAK